MTKRKEYRNMKIGVLLDEIHVVEAVAMIPSSSGHDRELVQGPKAGCGLSGVVNRRSRSRDPTDVFPRSGCDSRCALQQIQRGSASEPYGQRPRF